MESLDDWDDIRVRLAIGVDWSLVTMFLPLGERWVICKRPSHSKEPNAIPQGTHIRLIRFRYKNMKQGDFTQSQKQEPG